METEATNVNAPLAAPIGKASSVHDESKQNDTKKKKKKRSPLKKVAVIVSLVLGVLLALFLLLAIFISPIAHQIIEKHSKEICHRVVTMDDLKINLFKGTVDIQGFKALEEDDKSTFATFDRLFVDISLLKLLKETVQLNEITLNKPNIAVVQNGKRFNFTDIIEFYTKDKEEKDDDKESSWVVDLRNIHLNAGNIVYKDAQVHSKFDLRELSVAIPRIYFSTKQTNVGLDLKFADGGALNLKLLYSLKKNAYNLSVNLKQFALSSVAPYVRQFLNFNQFNGKLNTNLQLNGNLEHILDVVAKGNVSISNLSATDLNNKKIASVQYLNVPVKKVDVKNNYYHLGHVTLNGITTSYDVYKNSHSFDNLVKSRNSSSDLGEKAPADTAQTVNNSVPVNLQIDHISIKNSNVTYSDHTMRKVVTIPVTDLNVEMPHFALNKPLQAKVQAIIGNSGQLRADWSGSVSDLHNQKINLSLSNFKMALVSPYCYEYLAYPIEDGVISFVSRTSIVNNQLNSQNKIDIYNCQVGKKDKSFKPEFNIPLRAGLYVLTDRKGRLQLDLPVTGDLNSPNFSYKKIIFKAIGNLFVKVLAAPVDFLVKAIGGDPDVFADIEYEIRPQGLGSESYDKLNKIVDVMKQKPEMTLTLQQSIDLEENIQEYALFQAKRDYFVHKQGKQNLSMEDFSRIVEIKNTDPQFIKFVDERLTDKKGLIEIKEKCAALYDRSEIEKQINANLNMRKQMIINQFVTQGIAEEKLKFLELGNKKTPKGKTLLSFGVDLNEDEIQ